MSSLIIGGGLIGVHIAQEFINQENEDFIIQAHKIDMDYVSSITVLKSERIIQKPILNYDNLSTIIDDYNIKNIIVAAGSLPPSFKKHSGAALLNESQLLLSIQTACHKHSIDRLIYISSLGVYGTSEERSEKIIPKPVSSYGITKLYNEQIVKSIAENTSCKALVIRPCGTVGPNPYFSGNWMSNSLNRVIKTNEEQIKIDNDLYSPNEFLDVRDLSNFIVSNLERNNRFDVVNLGPGKITYGEELLGELRRIFKKDYFYIPNKEIVPTNEPLPIAKVVKDYDYLPKYNLRETLGYIGVYYGKIHN